MRARWMDRRMTATMRKAVSTYLPVAPGSAQPKAMPSFSMNWMSKTPGIHVDLFGERKGQLDAHLDRLVHDQHGRHDPRRMRGPGVGTQRRWSCWFLASMDIVACGTRRRRSLAMSLPVTRQTP